MQNRFARKLPILVFGLLIALRAVAQDDADLRRYTLDNGLRVWNLERDASDSVAVCLSIQVGSRNETKDNNGIAHFVEHMTFAGSERYDRNALMEMIQKRGGVQNAFTMEERTIYFGQISSRHFEILMEWLSQVVFHPTFPEDRIDGERNILFEEKGGKKDWLRKSVEALGQKIDIYGALRKGLFPESSLALPIDGEDRSLQATGHDELLAFYRAFYMPNNAVLVIAGNVAPDRVDRACREYFGALRPGTRPEACAAPAPVREELATTTLRAVTFTKQCTLLQGVRTCSSKDADRWALEVLAQYLGQTLMREGRYDRALAYNIGAHNSFYSDSGYFLVSTTCKHANFKPLRKLIDEQIDKLRNGQVDAEDLAEAKESLNGRWALAMETNLNQAMRLEWFSSVYAETEPLPSRDVMTEAVTAEDLTRVVKTYFVPERTCIAQHIPLI